LAAPILSLAIEWLYDFWLSGFEFWRTWFGTQLNFMHRVFVVFVICICIQVGMSLGLRAKREQEFFENPFDFKRLTYFLISQGLMLLLIFYFGVQPSSVSWLAALLSLWVWMDFRQPKNAVRISSSILMAITTWALYYFT